MLGRRRQQRRPIERVRRPLESRGGYPGSGSAEEARPPQRLPSAASRSLPAPPEAHHSPHSSPSPCCWVPIFVDWAEGRAERLDFGGKDVPERVQVLLETVMGPGGK